MIKWPILILLGAMCCTDVVAQAGTLILKTTASGFTGTFTSIEGHALTIEGNLDSDDQYSFQVVEGINKRIIAKSLFNKDVVLLTLSDVSLKFYVDKVSVEDRRIDTVTKSDQEKLDRFRLSSDASSLRQLIAAMIVQRSSVGTTHMKNVIIIGVILGDGMGTPENLQGVKTCKLPNLIQVYADAQRQDAELKLSITSNGAKTGLMGNDCKGCCGVGCSGCTGCYTASCWNHDHCVELNGYVSPICWPDLAMAVASIVAECNQV